MKIGILTQPLHNNYGGILQNYALQTVIKRFGHEVVTIDIQYPNKNIPISTRIVKYIWRMLKWFCGDRKILYFDSDIETAIAGNKVLVQHLPTAAKRDAFYADYIKYGYKTAIEKHAPEAPITTQLSLLSGIFMQLCKTVKKR